MAEPSISIIMPVYNSEKYLSACLDSILASTFENFELICVNDGSKDGSLNILNHYAACDARVIVIDQQNSGVSVSRNNALEKAKGKYVYFVDSDDVIHPQLLDICYHQAEKNGADLISFDFFEFKDDAQVHFDKIDDKDIETVVVDECLYKILPKSDYKINYNIWSKFYKKSILDDIRFEKNISLCEDIIHTFSVAAKSPITFLISCKLYAYRVLSSSLSHGNYNVKQIQDYRKCVEKVVALFCDNGEKFEFLKQNFIPVIIKHQLGRCRRVKNKTIGDEMKRELASELRYLNSLGALQKEYHKKSRWRQISQLLDNISFEMSLCGYPLFSVVLDEQGRKYKMFGLCLYCKNRGGSKK